MKYQITLDQVDYEKLLEIVTKAYEEGKLKRKLLGTIIVTTRVIYEPKN